MDGLVPLPSGGSGFAATTTMITARPILVPAPEARPGAHQRHRGRQRPDQACQQVLHFRGRERYERRAPSRRLWRTLVLALLHTDAEQEGVGEQHQRAMYVIRNRPCSPLNPLQPEEVLKTVKGIPRLLAPFARLRSVVGGIACCVRSTAASNLR